ncbi:hypothetical protein B0H13DRAFT_1200860 [Mycena leptocephala]|nr:hypothetical protein B0H13DRAFT_1200860 [Mycena leptocephala]
MSHANQCKNECVGQTSKSQGFIRQNEIAKDIERCHKMLTDCLTSFQLTSHVEIHDWQTQFRLDTQEDHRELLEYLVNLETPKASRTTRYSPRAMIYDR